MIDVTLQIFRYKAGKPPHYDTFTVQVADTAHRDRCHRRCVG